MLANNKRKCAGLPKRLFSFFKGIRIHDLRGAYVAAVGAMFLSPVSAPRMAMRVLGHDTLQDSLAYSHVRLQGVGELEGSLGPLHLH